MKILILGSGAREHALGWAAAREDPQAEIVFCPGNGGTAVQGRTRNLAGRLQDPASLVALGLEERPDLTIVGPEGPLAAGVVDRFREAGLPVFGPTAAAARLEGSKAFAKTLLRELGVPTPSFEIFCSPEKAAAAANRGSFPKVIKADGLAAGKGVFIAASPEEARAAVGAAMDEGKLGAAGETILIESFVAGEEISAFALARGTEFTLLPLSQDHKRIGEGDSGPNTGGMGAVAPVSRGGEAMEHTLRTEIFAPVLWEMEARGTPFTGLLYAGLILVEGRPQVLEFNCRFGDPETEAVLPLLGGGFLEALLAVATSQGPLPPVAVLPGSAATVVLASEGYPGSYRTGLPVRGLERVAAEEETFVFHAGTRREGNTLVTAGGRVLAVTARGGDLPAALERAYRACALVEFEGKTYRRDIGRRALGLSAPC